jgi:hypothetical protein
MSDYTNNIEGISDAVTQMMLDIVLVLKSYGIEEVPASNVMRLLGTEEEEAKRWEQVILSVTENGELELTNIEQGDSPDEIPPILH